MYLDRCFAHNILPSGGFGFGNDRDLVTDLKIMRDPDLVPL